MNLYKILSIFLSHLILSRIIIFIDKIKNNNWKLSSLSIMTSKANENIMNVDLHLVRHGETIANAQNVLQGHCDYPLTEKGINEGNCVGIALSNMDWDKVYCSDLGRASHTCKLLLTQSKTNVNPIVEENKITRELCFGVREALSKETSIEEAKIIVAKKLGISPGDVIDTAETFEQLKARQKSLLTKIIEDLSSFNDRNDTINILVVSHGGYIKYFLKTFLSITGNHYLQNILLFYNDNNINNI